MKLAAIFAKRQAKVGMDSRPSQTKKAKCCRGEGIDAAGGRRWQTLATKNYSPRALLAAWPTFFSFWRAGGAEKGVC